MASATEGKNEETNSSDDTEVSDDEIKPDVLKLEEKKESGIGTKEAEV